jgi:hypothetical protein
MPDRWDFDSPWRTLGFSSGPPDTALLAAVEAYVRQAQELVGALLAGGQERDSASAARHVLDDALDTVTGYDLKVSFDRRPR